LHLQAGRVRKARKEQEASVGELLPRYTELYPKRENSSKKKLFAKGKRSVMYLAVVNVATVAYNKGEPYVETRNR
jgi:hypothetical protein